MNETTIPWQEALSLATKISQSYDENWCFLYSGLHEEIQGSKSFIALFEDEVISTDNFFQAQEVIRNSDEKFFGYISYENAKDFEDLEFSDKEFIKQTPIYLSSYHLILEFCHKSKTLTCHFSDDKYLDFIHNIADSEEFRQAPKAMEINSNFSDEEYLKAISLIQENIAKGDFYQTNLTRKFYGRFEQELSSQDNFGLFAKLTQISPANYSSFLKIGDNHIISSSPELFLSSQNNDIISRPIKGTSPKSEDPQIDHQNIEYLRNSSKEKAENLMIVDLVRNDLSRICEPSTIKVENLFKISSYKNIHHMSSEISGRIDKNFDSLDAIASSFPPGSMTGAPKIEAIKTASKLEEFKRGIYSGCIGMISQNYLNLSVVIRTMITNEDKFEFQIGGAITYSSDPESELEEVYNKAKGLTNLMDIDLKKHTQKNKL